MNIFLGLLFLCIGFLLLYFFIKNKWYNYEQGVFLEKTRVFEMSLAIFACIIIGIMYLFNLWE